MGKVNALRQDLIEALCEGFQAGEITTSEFSEQMVGYGFEPDEIDDHVGALQPEQVGA